MKLKFLLILFCLLMAGPNLIAQVVPEYDLGGASRPRPDLSFRSDDQYKRVHQTALRQILRGQLDKTETFLDEFLATHSDDEETLFLLGVLKTQRGDLEQAISMMKRAIDAGLPEGRILAGPKTLIKPLTKTEWFDQLASRFSSQLVHGPMLGNVTDKHASFWVRTSGEREIVVQIMEPQSKKILTQSKPVNSTADQDFTAVATVSDLNPNTKYQYTVLIDGQPCASNSFRTFSPNNQPSKFSIAFGGGAGYVPQNERMWNTIGETNPQALLLLGDNVYIDDPESAEMQRYTYHRRQSRPEWRKLTAGTSVFSIWDDHDFGTNDCWGGADVAIPFWKTESVFPIFRQNWANPGYGGGTEQPGCWYAFQIGDIDFIMLDCRYYRTNPKEHPRSMLGETQKKWLKDQLKSAKGTFKVVCSSVPWDFRTKGKSLDTWNGFPEEHEEILSFLDANQIEGVLLMSADRHRSDAWKISRPNGYDLYEFNSSRLTNQHIHPTMEKKGAIFSYNRPQSFGLVTFDTTAADPTATYEVVNIDGEKPHSITVKRSQLKRSQLKRSQRK